MCSKGGTKNSTIFKQDSYTYISFISSDDAKRKYIRSFSQKMGQNQIQNKDG
jgi:hypothetical protein